MGAARGGGDAACSGGGRPRQVDRREVVHALRYTDCTGCPWRRVPTDVPHRSTVRFDLYAQRLRLLLIGVDAGVDGPALAAWVQAERDYAPEIVRPSAGQRGCQTIPNAGSWRYRSAAARAAGGSPRSTNTPAAPASPGSIGRHSSA